MRMQKYDVRQALLLYAVSDGNLPAIEQALRGGATLLQLRAKGLSDDELLALARDVKCLADKFDVSVIINDRVDIAAKIDAAGAHLGLSDGDLRAARARLGPGKILGATARSVEQALAAEAAGADYLGSGAVFGSQTKTDAIPMQLAKFQEICSCVRIPVVAIGGIDQSNITQLRGCGMSGFAIVSGIFGQENIESATRELRKLSKELVRYAEG